MESYSTSEVRRGLDSYHAMPCYLSSKQRSSSTLGLATRFHADHPANQVSSSAEHVKPESESRS